MVGFNFELENVEDYDWMTLEEDEKIEWRSHPSVIPKLPEIIGGPVIALIILVVTIFMWSTPIVGEFTLSDEPASVLISLGLMLLFIGDSLWTYYQIKATFYIFTDDKFIRKDNIFRVKTMEVPYSKIQHAEHNQSFWERAFNIGTFSLATAGTGRTEVILKHVPNPKKPKDIVSNYT